MKSQLIKHLFLGFGVVVVLLSLVVGYGYWKSNESNPAPHVKEIRLTPQTIHIGEVIQVVFYVEMPWYRILLDGIELDLPEGLQILDAKRMDWPTFNWITWQWQFVLELQAYDFGPFQNLSGEFSLTPDRLDKGRKLSVSLPEIIVDPKFIDDESTLSMASELPKEFLKMRKDSIWKWATALIGICAVLAFSFLWLRKRKPKRIQEQPKPWVIAENSLFKLEDRFPLNAETVFVELTDIIRRYIESVYAFPATESTTPEFLDQLKRNHTELSLDHGLLLTDFLTSADMVKFARVDANQGQIEDAMKKAKKFIVETSEAKIREEASKDQNLENEKKKDV